MGGWQKNELAMVTQMKTLGSNNNQKITSHLGSEGDREAGKALWRGCDGQSPKQMTDKGGK